MEGPALLSSELSEYKRFETEKELLQALIKKPSDFIDFFEAACADETWCEAHLFLVRSLFRWGAKLYYLSQFPSYYAQRMMRAVQEHFALLEPILHFRASLFFTVQLEIENHSVPVNSLMFGAASPFFFNVFKMQCFDEMSDAWALEGASFSVFQLVQQYIYKGTIAELWRYEYPDIYALMDIAKTWYLPYLVKECAQILRRYIDPSNVIQTLLKAHREFFSDWKQYCIEFFNQQGWGLCLLPSQEADIKVEVLDYREDTLERFKQLSKWVTHLAFRGHVSEDPMYQKIIEQCPKLVGIDLSGSLTYANQFESLSSQIVDLDLSACAWLDPLHLREANTQFPFLKELNLSSNLHLSYLAWAGLSQFRYLTTLHLARCHQVSDEDLKLISQSCSNLTELNLEECRGFTDQGVMHVLQYCPSLHLLTLSRCYAITDRALIEIGLRAQCLTHLSLVRCTSLTDKGLAQFLHFRRSLRYLDIRQCDFSFKLLAQIKRQLPLLEIIE